MSVGKEILMSQTIITKAVYVLSQFDKTNLKGILTDEEIEMLPKVRDDEMFKLVLLEKELKQDEKDDSNK